MTPFRFAIAVCCGLAASSVLYVSQKADGSTLAEVAPASIQTSSPSAGVAAAPPHPALAASASLASTPPLTASVSAVPKPAPQPPATRSAAVRPLPAASASHPAPPNPTAAAKPPLGPKAVPAKAPTAALAPPEATTRQAAKHAPGKQAEPVPKRIIIRHSQPGDVVFTMQGEELQVEFRQAPSPKRQGGRS
ncbi:MAG TPA: hypothetical protein V6D00_10005 [Pantanalinema sp.]